MSEESAGASEVTDPTALSLAFGGASREKADAYLDDQRHHIREQLKQIHLDIFEKWVGVALRLATLIVGLAAATGVGLMVWDAAHSKGLLIEPFSVPPDMAEKGLTGQVIASQVLDRLTAIQGATLSFRPPLSYANNWGKDIKVEIPETGVSIGEFRRFLREWLGNDIHISGEVWHTDSGLAISARTSGERGETYSGSPSELDALVQKAAEHVYAQTQPYRYANYIRGRRRLDEARAAYLKLTESPSALERGWAWQGISTLPAPEGSSSRNAAWALRRAIAEYPDYTLAYASLATAERAVGHDEAALAAGRNIERLFGRSSIPDIDPIYVATARKSWTMGLPASLGDFSQAAALARSGMPLPDQAGQRSVMRAGLTLALARQHDGAATRAAWRDQSSQVGSQSTSGRNAVTRFQVEGFRENWPGVLALQAETEQAIEAATRLPVTGNPFDRNDVLRVSMYPWIALAKARMGDQTGGEVMISRTPDDCYVCVNVRGMIASQDGRWDRADSWFAKAIHDGPSLPFAYSDWGRSMLARRQPDAAIEKFKQANEKGPHFADPLEGWGEALMAKNQSHRALEKFAEAEKYTPNWGRLHLKWGKAIAYSGRRDEAAKHFARAAALDLTPSEKLELAQQVSKS